MEITLTNFKCHKKKQIKIDKNGLILFDGSSGIGKSSIFESIYFALYGVGKRLINHNMKKMEVNIKFIDLNLQINRSKGPNRLVVINKNGEFEDDIAQEIINEMFGDQFLITSYITQDNDSSFLKLSSSEKMEFLEKQAFISEVNIDELKKLTKEEIKMKKLKVQKFTNSIELIQNELKELKEPEYMEFPLKGKLDEQENKLKIFNDEIKVLEHDIDITNKELIKLNKEYDVLLVNEKQFNSYELDKQKYTIEINNIEKKLNDLPSREELKNNNISIDKINEEISKLNNKLEQLKNKDLYLNKKNKYQEDLTYYKELYNKEIEEQKLKKEQYQKEYDELKNIINKKDINEIKKLKLDLENKEKLLIDKKDKIILYNQYVSKLNKYLTFKDPKEIEITLKEKKDKISTLKDKIQLINSRLSFISCPHCSKSLILYKDTIKKAEGTTVSKEEKEDLIKSKDEIKKLENEISEIEPLYKKLLQLNINNIDNIDEIEKEIKNLNNEINKFENDISEINTNTYKLSVLEKQLNSTQGDVSKTLIDMKNKLKEDKKIIDKLKENIHENNNDNEEDIDTIRNKISTLHKLNSEYKTLNEQYNFFKNKLESINKNIDNILKIISNKSNLENDINILKNKQEDLKVKQKENNKMKQKLKKYEEYKTTRDNFEKWQNKLEEAKINEEEKSKELALINKYWNKILECESMAVLNIIETINHNINIYLEKFFDENSINVSLSSFKETKKSIKHCINVNIFYKGETCDLNSLSGGERSRINLAFLLALNNLTNGKIVLLDECIASLDAQLCDDILEILKEQNKMILVIAHQVNTGLFDQVVEI